MKISLEIDTDSLEKDVYAELKRVMAFEMDSFVKQNVRSMVIAELDKMEHQQYSVLVQRIENIVNDALVKSVHNFAVNQVEMTKKIAHLQGQLDILWERLGVSEENDK